jgi:hypothetical protein
MLQTIQDPTLEQSGYLASEFKKSLQEKCATYAAGTFNNIRTIQNYYNNLLLLRNHYKYDLFGITVTWLKKEIANGPDCVKGDFCRFYVRVLLPFLIDDKRFDRSSFAQQPICVATVESGKDGHKPSPKKGNQANLHNHGIIASKYLVSSNLIRLLDANDPKKILRDYVKKSFIKKKKDDALDIINHICSMKVVRVTKDPIEQKKQIEYPFKQFGKFSKYVSEFPEAMDWTDIASDSFAKPKRISKVTTQGNLLSDGSNHYLESYF